MQRIVEDVSKTWVDIKAALSHQLTKKGMAIQMNINYAEQYKAHRIHSTRDLLVNLDKLENDGNKMGTTKLKRPLTQIILEYVAARLEYKEKKIEEMRMRLDEQAETKQGRELIQKDSPNNQWIDQSQEAQELWFERINPSFRNLVECAVRGLNGWTHKCCGELPYILMQMHVSSITQFLEEYRKIGVQLAATRGKTLDFQIMEKMMHLLRAVHKGQPLYMLLVGIESVEVDEGKMHGWSDGLRQALHGLEIKGAKSWMLQMPSLVEHLGGPLNYPVMHHNVLDHIQKNLPMCVFDWTPTTTEYETKGTAIWAKKMFRREEREWKEFNVEDESLTTMMRS
jgi:hypothetical protein